MEGYPVGMLDRDQRTAKMCVCEQNVQSLVLVDGFYTVTKISHRTCIGTTSSRSWKNRHFWKSLHRLKHALIVTVYLSLLTFPSILSAPTLVRRSIPMSSSRHSSTPRWWNPCGITIENGVQNSDSYIPKLNIQPIVTQVKIYKSSEEIFSGEFVSKMFKGEDLKSVHRQYGAQTYNFLPNIKVLGKAYQEKIPQHILDSAELDETLILAYENLQRVAVGIEQMLWDEEDRGGEFLKAFQNTWNSVNNLLCEIHNVIIEKSLTIENQIGRDIMGDTLRQASDDTARNVRNWIIYREYLNMLEYIEQVFSHLQHKLKTV